MSFYGDIDNCKRKVMSRTTDILIKAEESPSSLTPAERAFVGLHEMARIEGHPCDCPRCAPELYDEARKAAARERWSPDAR
jgi:hypothetical protein